MDMQHLHATATQLVAPGKGIFAADESLGTIQKRLGVVGVESTEVSRRDYREMLFRTADALGEAISGVILFEETLRQAAEDGTPLIDLITRAGPLPGIKVDQGAKPLALARGEMVTEGLDGLRERLEEYYQIGARFAKWRAVFDIGRRGDKSIPSAHCVDVNVHALARYAALCQEQNLVPVVEPDILMDGDNDIDRCAEVTEFVLRKLFAQLYEHKVALEGVVLKPNMVVPGKEASQQASSEEIAEWTIRCFRRAVPAAVPGIVLLSGGQSEEEATAHLNAMNAGNYDVPWRISFSYGRALQNTALKVWGGEAGNVPAAQEAFRHRAHMNSLAVKGQWRPELERRSF